MSWHSWQCPAVKVFLMFLWSVLGEDSIWGSSRCGLGRSESSWWWTASKWPLVLLTENTNTSYHQIKYGGELVVEFLFRKYNPHLFQCHAVIHGHHQNCCLNCFHTSLHHPHRALSAVLHASQKCGRSRGMPLWHPLTASAVCVASDSVHSTDLSQGLWDTHNTAQQVSHESLHTYFSRDSFNICVKVTIESQFFIISRT